MIRNTPKYGLWVQFTNKRPYKNKNKKQKEVKKKRTPQNPRSAQLRTFHCNLKFKILSRTHVKGLTRAHFHTSPVHSPNNSVKCKLALPLTTKLTSKTKISRTNTINHYQVIITRNSLHPTRKNKNFEKGETPKTLISPTGLITPKSIIHFTNRVSKK